MAPPVPYRTARPLRLLLFGLGSVVTLLMILWGSAQALDALSIEEERVARSYLGVTAIDLRHAHGNVDLVAAAGRRTIVAIDSRHGFLSGHDREDTLRGGVLRLRGSCDFVTLGTCDEDYRIEVPRGVSVSVRTSAGATTATGLRGGELDLRSSAGPVTATGIRARDVVLRSRAGAVSAEAVRARRIEADSRAGGVSVERSVARRVRATSSAGRTQVELLRPPLSVVADSKAGGVTVWLPDAAYAVAAHTAAGEEDVQVRQRPGARRTIRAESSAGDVRVLPLGER